MMSFALLRSDGKTSRRRWFIVAVFFTLVALIIATANHYRQNHYGEINFPTPESVSGFAKDVRIKEYVKPEGVKVIGLVFYGRRNRVEILRCYLEVRA